MVLPLSRLQLLTEWIGHLDEQCVDLEDMEEIVPRDPKPPKPEDEAYKIENYTLQPERREELKKLIEGYSDGYMKLLAFLKATYHEWDDHYQAEPDKCTNPGAEEEIRRRLFLIEEWISDVEPIEKLDIDDLTYIPRIKRLGRTQSMPRNGRARSGHTPMPYLARSRCRLSMSG
jgi:hypothetical protein